MELMDRLRQEIGDLLALTNAKECGKCGRYYLSGYLCQNCNHDNSLEEDEDE